MPFNRGKRRSVLPAVSHCRPQPLIATIIGPAPALPLPFLPTTLGSGIGLLCLNARVFLEAILQRELKTPVSIGSLKANPRHLEVCAQNVHVTDRTTGPLLNVPSLSLRFMKIPSNENTTKKHRLRVSATGATIVATFERSDLRRTNWLTFADRLSQNNDNAIKNTSVQNTSMESRIPTPSVEVILKSSTVALKQPDSGLALNVAVGTIRVESESIERSVRAADVVIAQALRKAGTKSLPRVLRDGARRRIREEIKRTAQIAASRGAAHVKRFQGNVDKAERFIEGMPDSEGVRTWLRGARSVLQGVESLLKDTGADDRDENDRIEPDQTEEEQQEEDFLDISEYRELDES